MDFRFFGIDFCRASLVFLSSSPFFMNTEGLFIWKSNRVSEGKICVGDFVSSCEEILKSDQLGSFWIKPLVAELPQIP